MEQQFETFQCECGSKEFNQTCYVKIFEIIEIKRNGNDIKIISKNVEEINTEDIENEHEIFCVNCGKEYKVIKKDGRDSICEIQND
jgi:hypothetical protein